MVKKIISPVTRISGFLEVEVEIEGKTIIDAKSRGVLFRGFEIMLNGRSPLDAVYFTQRICGICSTAHAVVATLALEDAFNLQPSEQGRQLRAIVHCCEFLQNHLRHFYQYTIPDFVKFPENQSLFEVSHNDFRLPKEINDRIVKNYFLSVEQSRSAHEMLAIFAGKAPHNHGIFLDGLTVHPTTDKLAKFTALLSKISNFIDEAMLPDVYDISKYYQEYFELGKGPENFLSFGLFNDVKVLEEQSVKPSVYINGKAEMFNEELIREYVNYSWYEGDRPQQPANATTIPIFPKPEAYTWSKAPRYKDQPCEVGPLARLILSEQYPAKASMMDRTIARVLETKKITLILKILLNSILPDVTVQRVYDIPKKSEGLGLSDTLRGALGHWIKIDNNVISHYQVITPSAWNLSPKDTFGKRGVAEQALIGTELSNPDDPIEIGRILRSFDPCISCATHVINAGSKKIIRIM